MEPKNRRPDMNPPGNPPDPELNARLNNMYGNLRDEWRNRRDAADERGRKWINDTISGNTALNAWQPQRETEEQRRAREYREWLDNA